MVFYITMVTFWMTFLKNKRTFVVMHDVVEDVVDDVHPSAKSLPSLNQQLVMKYCHG